MLFLNVLTKKLVSVKVCQVGVAESTLQRLVEDLKTTWSPRNPQDTRELGNTNLL